jgi:two-component system, NarL family, nitrate/nitrite response regulator NarL
MLLRSGVSLRAERRTLIVLSEHELFRDALASMLKRAGYHPVDLATTSQLRGKNADSILVDLDHASIDVTVLLHQVGQHLDGAYVIALGSAIRLGAAGVEVGACAELETQRGGERAVLDALAHRPPTRSPELRRTHRLWAQVTRRQRDTLRWLAVGLDNAAIASRMSVGERAVKAHVSALLALFALHNRTELALYASQAGVLPLDG